MLTLSKDRAFATQLFMLIKTAHIHHPSNQAFRQPFEQLLELTGTLLKELGSLTLETVEVGLYLNEKKVRSDISTFGVFEYIDGLFASKEVGGFTILRPPRPEEMIFFVQCFLPQQRGLKGSMRLNEALATRGFQSIQFLPRTKKRSRSKDEVVVAVSSQKRALRDYTQAMEVVRTLSSGDPKAQLNESRKAKRAVYDLVDICLDEGFSFMGLSSIKNYDEYTFNHSMNVCIISIGFGKNLGLSKRQIGELGLAALYHDYGKTLIPVEILNKPGKFEPKEWEVMKTHPVMAIKRFLTMKGEFQPADIKKMIASFEHHRNFDLSGYPQTGMNKKLNFFSRVVAISDAFDAMTTNRVYQRGMLPTLALKIIADSAGTKFDPLLVKAFINTIGIYPVGSVVSLSSGVLAVVTKVNENPNFLAYPTVRIVTNSQGQKIEGGREVNLAVEAENPDNLVIEAAVHPEDHGINVAHYLFPNVA
ncbi:MAG: HD-GYP domain-containing protein [Pseudomonadota bacterium]